MGILGRFAPSVLAKARASLRSVLALTLISPVEGHTFRQLSAFAGIANMSPLTSTSPPCHLCPPSGNDPMMSTVAVFGLIFRTPWEH